jgi:hypothetical protein
MMKFIALAIPCSGLRWWWLVSLGTRIILILYLVEVVGDSQEPVFRWLVVPGKLFSPSGGYPLRVCVKPLATSRRLSKWHPGVKLRKSTKLAQNRRPFGGNRAQKWGNRGLWKMALSCAANPQFEMQ